MTTPHTSRRRALLGSAAVATTALFAGGTILTQLVIVPHWRALEPTAFLPHFAVYGPLIGSVQAPIEVVSALLLGICAVVSRAGRPAWTVASVAMVGTLVLLPIYFLPANFAMLDPGFPPGAVPGELTAWSAWNWVRVGLAVAAVVASCAALAARQATARFGPEPTTPPRVSPSS